MRYARRWWLEGNVSYGTVEMAETSSLPMIRMAPAAEVNAEACKEMVIEAGNGMLQQISRTARTAQYVVASLRSPPIQQDRVPRDPESFQILH